MTTTDIPVMDFETFATQHGASIHDIGDSGNHSPRGHMSTQHNNRVMKEQAKHDSAIVANRAELRKEYDQLIADGKLRDYTNLERLEMVADGDPDSERSQAAQRVIAKRKARAAQADAATVVAA